MKKFMILLCLSLFIVMSAFAGQYNIILKDGTKINVDSYRKADGKVYYPSSYGIEGFVDESAVARIVDLKKQIDKSNLLKKVSEGDENAIESTFLLIGERLAYYINKQGSKKVCWDYYSLCDLFPAIPRSKKNNVMNRREYLTSFSTDIEAFKYSLDKTDSIIFPYRGTLQFDIVMKNTETNETILKNHVHVYRFSKDRKRWEFVERKSAYPGKEYPSYSTCAISSRNYYTSGYTNTYGSDDGCLFDGKALEVQDMTE